MYLSHHFLIVQFLVIGFTQCGQAWSRSNSEQTGKLKDLDVICGKDHMTVRAEFDGPFNGIVSSKGSSGQGNCVYIKSHSNLQHATFKVMYNECGTKPDLQGRYYENTIVIQYGTDIIEAMDEAKRLRCEWFEAYEKPATFRPAIPVADLDVVEMNFQGDDIDCWMEIQIGKGPWSQPINRIVPVGSLMTIVIAIADQSSQFDMRVKSCFAHDGVKPPVQLTDEYGCVLRKSMLSEFSKIRGPDFRKNLGENAAVLNGYLGKATVISYAHFYAFKFPDSMSVQMQCTVEVCRNGCPAACDSSGYPPPNAILKPKISFNQAPNRKNENNQQPPNQRGNTRRYQSYDHSHRDIVLDDDVALTAAESNHQPAAILPLELPNHRRAMEEDAEHKNNNQISNEGSNAATGAGENGNDIKLNNEQILLITTTPKPTYKLNEDALQHENSKLINELKQFAGMDLNRLTENLLNVKQASAGGNLNQLNGLLMSKPTDQAILDSLPSLTSHIQQLQNDHLEKVFQNERLRELALESGLKLNQINEYLPQAQPLTAIGGKTASDNSTIDFDNLLNSVNNLISAQSANSTAVPFQSVSTTTSTQSPVTENKDLYLEEEPASDDIPGLTGTDDALNEASSKQAEAQEKSALADQSRVNVRVLNHQLPYNGNQFNQFKHEPLPKNQPSYIIETTPSKPAPLNQPLSPAQSKPLAQASNNVAAGMAPLALEPQSTSNKNPPPPPPPPFNSQQSINKQRPSINYFYQNGHLLHSPNLIQPLMNHQHHQPLQFQYLPFNSLPVNSLPLNLNSFSSLNGLPMSLLANGQTPVAAKPAKQTSKLANLFKQNSLTQYGYSLLQSFKKDKTQNDPANAGILSLFPAGTRALRVGRNVRMQIPNKLGRIKLKRENGDGSKVRTRRSVGSHVSVKQEFQVVTPLDMQFSDYGEQELGQPELLQGRSDLQVKEAKSLVCIQFKSSLMIASVLALLLFALSVLACILMFKRYKKLEN